MKIHNIILTILSSALLFASCSDTDEQRNDASAEIVFGQGNIASRGTAINGPTLSDGNSFGVYAFRVPSQGGGLGSSSISAIGGYMGSAFTRVNVTSSGCTYSPTSSWPSNVNDQLKFFAYYPYQTSMGNYIQSVSTGTTSGKDPYMNITYKADQDPVNHLDLMYAATTDVSRVNVLISLKHALTRVSFSAQAAKGDVNKPASIKIKRFDIFGVSDNGVLTVASDGTPSWEAGTYDNTVATYSFSQDNSILKDFYVPEKVNDSDELYENIISDSRGSIMFVPQQTDDLMIAVALTIDYNDGSTSEEKNFFMPSQIINWEPGKHIHYRLTVARDVISMTANVVAWDKKDGPSLPLD